MPPNPSSIFRSYPPELIAHWCGVSVKTAALYKAGRRRPSRQALRLFALHRDGRVLGSEWRDWKMVRGQLFDPEGNVCTQGMLRAYGLVLQWVAATVSHYPGAQQRFYEILAIASDSPAALSLEAPSRPAVRAVPSPARRRLPAPAPASPNPVP